MDAPEIAQIQETLAVLAERREQLQLQVKYLRGAEKSIMMQRISALYDEEGDTAYALRVLLGRGKGAQMDNWIRILTGGRYV